MVGNALSLSHCTLTLSLLQYANTIPHARELLPHHAHTGVYYLHSHSHRHRVTIHTTSSSTDFETQVNIEDTGSLTFYIPETSAAWYEEEARRMRGEPDAGCCVAIVSKSAARCLKI